MRHDMKRVIITPSRKGGGDYKVWTRARRKRDDRSHEPMGRGWGSKSFSDFLNPVRGFLRKNAGRPWADVWHDVCQHADIRSIDGWHLRTHIERDIVNVSGRTVRYSHYEFHVDDNGVLRYEARGGWRQRRRPPKAPEPDFRLLGCKNVLRKIDGIWYQVAIRPVRDEDYQIESYFFLGRKKERPSIRHLWTITIDRKIYTQDESPQKQLNTKELKRHAITNDPPQV